MTKHHDIGVGVDGGAVEAADGAHAPVAGPGEGLGGVVGSSREGRCGEEYICKESSEIHR